MDTPRGRGGEAQGLLSAEGRSQSRRPPNGTTGQTVVVIVSAPELSDAVRVRLALQGYEALTAADARTGLRLLYETRPAGLVMGVALPDMDGWDLCRVVRQMCDVPIIVLTPKGEFGDWVHGVELGADDYVAKPLDPDELVARVRALLRRADLDGRNRAWALLSAGQIQMNIATHNVYVGGKVVRLTPTEFRVLECLVEQQGRVVPQEEILRRVWGGPDMTDPDALRIYIRLLRKKIESDPSNPTLLLTERGIGYRLANQ